MTDNNQFHPDNEAPDEIVESPIEEVTRQGGWGSEVATSSWNAPNNYSTGQLGNPGGSYSEYTRAVGQPYVPASATGTQRSYSYSLPAASGAVAQEPLAPLSYSGPNLGPTGRRGLAPRIVTVTPNNPHTIVQDFTPVLRQVFRPGAPIRRSSDHNHRVAPTSHPGRSLQRRQTTSNSQSSQNAAESLAQILKNRALHLASHFSWMIEEGYKEHLAGFIEAVPSALDIGRPFFTEHPADFDKTEIWRYSVLTGGVTQHRPPLTGITTRFELSSDQERREVRAGLAHTAIALFSVATGSRNAHVKRSRLKTLETSMAFQEFDSAVSSALAAVPSATKKRVSSWAIWDPTKPLEDAIVWEVEAPDGTKRSNQQQPQSNVLPTAEQNFTEEPLEYGDPEPGNSPRMIHD